MCNFVADCHTEFETGGYELDVTIPDEQIFYTFDKVQFERVFDNLFATFFKHNPPKSILYLKLKCQPDAILVTVADNGSGITSEDAE